MLEDQVASLLQRYLGNYVRGLNKEALKISVWRGDVELKNMQLKPEALNALKLPVKVKAGFLGSVRIEVPWSRLGQEPVIVYLDRILILAEPATHVEESNEDAIQEAKRTRVQEMESRLLEGHQLPKSEMTSSWLGSFINTIIGNLRLSITNVHIRYEDLESNPGHPFAAGLTLGRLSAFTIDDAGKETFVTGDALDRIQKSVELERLALYLDSDISPWSIDKRWEDLLPSEWSQIFELEPRQNNSENIPEDHRYFLQPVTGNARYTKLKMEQSKNMALPLQKASVNLEDVTLCLSEDGYKDILRLADNFSAFNKRLKYAHYRPHAPISSDPRCWWKYAFKVVTDEAKNASGIVSWDQLLRHAKLRKRYVSLYASLLKYSRSWDVAHGNEELKKLDQELDMNVILQWRMLAHEFVMQSTGSAFYQKKQKTPQSWWSFGWTGSSKEEEEESDRSMNFTEEDWERLNKFIGYKESDEKMLNIQEDGSLLQLYLEFHMKHNASKLIKKDRSYLADLSCDNLDCSVKVYSEAKIFDLKLGSYRLSSPNGLLAESATVSDSLVGVFSYKPFGAKLDWSFVAKASPCYMTYLKDSIHNILSFFKNSTAISQTLALETAAAVQMTLDEVKRSAQKQFASALRDHTRFFLDLDISAPKITIPAEFHAKNAYTTRLLLDLGHLKLLTQDEDELSPSEREYLNFQFNVVLSDVSAFMVDEEYSWSNDPILPSNLADLNNNGVLPVIDKCGIVLKLQQVRMENPLYQGTRLAFHLPVLAFHFSPARYHRLMEVFKLFQDDRVDATDMIHPWSQADFGGWLSILSWKGVGNREAVWQRRYLCVAGQFLYVLENPSSTIYKQCYSLRGKQVHQITLEFLTEDEHILALCDAGQLSSKVVEDANAIILHCGTDEYCKLWQSRIQGAIYRTSGPAVVAGLSDVLTPEIAKQKQLEDEGVHLSNMERFFVTGILDELKIRFDYNSNNNQSFEEMLLGKESGLLEFKAIGGQVEVSIRENDLFIGTILKSLEIQDLFHSEGAFKPRYLAKSFIKNIGESPGNSSPSITYVGDQSSVTSEQIETDAEEKFYEAYDNLSDVTDSSIAPQGDITEFFSFRSYFPSETSSIQTLSFNHVPGLLPDAESLERSDFKEPAALDSFVKAQIIIFDQGSSLYTSIDKQVMLSVGSLSFFFHRPTILATMEFINAVNAEDIQGASQGDASANETNDLDNVPGPPEFDISQEPIIKGLLGRGKSRAIFYLMLNMARAQIFLMNEDEKSLGTLSQNNLLVDIKVFPSSFQIKAALGNLKISDDSLPLGHSYFWVCDMRNPDGSSFVKLDIESYNPEDEDYPGYDYSLIGELSEIRLVYLNRFIQELLSYFTGLASTDSIGFVRLKDKMTDSEKWFTTAELQGSPALKLDLSLSKPIILMPRGTHSLDYLQLDVPEIAVQNTFQWLGGDVNDMNAVRLETMTIKIKDINLTIGTGTLTGESIIQDVKGLSIIIQRSLRDLLHQIPSTQIDIKVIELSASLSNKEYEIVTECALSNISETPDLVPPLSIPSHAATTDEGGSLVSLASVSPEGTIEERIWDNFKMMISIGLVELSLHSGAIRDSSLATVQVHGAWVLYRSDSVGQAFLSSTLMDFSIIDNREGTLEEFRLAIGKHESVPERLLSYEVEENRKVGGLQESEVKPEIYAKSVLAMLILDVKFKKSSTIISLCVQRPHLLVALDFLLAVVQFFVPTVQNILTDERDKDDLRFIDAIIPDQIVYTQPSPDFSLSPMKPLIIESEKSDHLIYDGKGGHLCLNDRLGTELSDYSAEPIIFIGNGKRLQFKNVHVKNGRFLDSCIYLGANSSYSASEDDNVSLGSKGEDVAPESPRQTMTRMNHSNAPVGASPKTEYILEFQAISPGLTFYSISGNIEDSLVFSTKLLHAQFDMFCRVCMKDDAMDLCGDVLGLTLESNGIRVLEPFTINASFSNTSGKTKLHVSTSDIYVNFSFSILKLFVAIQDDILEFMRMTTNKFSVVCSQFDKVGTIQTFQREHTYAFWRPRAPPGFAVLGDCLTPLNEPPTKGVTAVNISFARVQRPVSFRLIWPSSEVDEIQECKGEEGNGSNNGEENGCSLWFPVAPKGYVAVGCVVSPGRTKPPLSSALCISSSFVSSCPLKDCISFQIFEPYSTTLALWRVDNSFGSFLPTEPSNTILMGHGYDLRHLCFRYPELVSNQSAGSIIQPNVQLPEQAVQSERYPFMMSGQFFEHVSSFRLIWWNQGTTSCKKLSIWRPVIPEGTAYFGDIAVHGYEPPDMCMIARNIRGSKLLRPACGFQLVGHIQKGKGAVSLSIWLPQPPPGFVSLGCIASKGPPKQEDISTFRCVRSDFITSCTFFEESIWDSSDTETAIETFSIWVVSNEACTFFARKGLKRPPKRFALTLIDSSVSDGADDTVIDLEMKAFSATIYDDYAGLMVPLCNIAFSQIGFCLRRRLGWVHSSLSFSLETRSYNDKIDSWEPFIEPIHGVVRYQDDLHAPGVFTQLRITTTKDLNIIVSVSNTNMILQAYSSWNSLNSFSGLRKKAVTAPTCEVKSVVDIHRRRNYHIIPRNKLGQDIYIRVTERRNLSDIIRMPSGDNKLVNVPVSKNLMDSHLQGKHNEVSRSVVSVIVADAEFPPVEELTAGLYTTSVRLFHKNSIESSFQQAHSRTRGAASEHISSGLDIVEWNEAFVFKVDDVEHYVVEFTVINIAKDAPVGSFSAPLKEIAVRVHPSSRSSRPSKSLCCGELSRETMVSHSDTKLSSPGRIRFSVLIQERVETLKKRKDANSSSNSFIQISPTRYGPWTTVRLNYAAPAACWRLGNDVIASELSVLDGNRYVNIRSLVSVTNKTDYGIEICLKTKALSEDFVKDHNLSHDVLLETDELFETEKFVSSIGWVGCSLQMPFSDQPIQRVSDASSSEMFTVDLPAGWEWVDVWHIENSSTNNLEGWIYAPNSQQLKWPESSSPESSLNTARQRKWVRRRKLISSDFEASISLELLKPGETLPLPLKCLVHPLFPYYLQLRPRDPNSMAEYSWSKALSNENNGFSDICVSKLSKSDEILCCMRAGESSSDGHQALWFCLSIQSSEIRKDIHSDPIHDWNLVVDSPLSITNFLPLTVKYSIHCEKSNGHLATCHRDIFQPGETSKVYNVDLREALYLSLLPRGWEPVDAHALVSHPNRIPAKTLNLRSCFSGRVVSVILDQSHEKGQTRSRLIRLYVPYWISAARCPPLAFKFVDLSKRREGKLFSRSTQENEKVVFEIFNEEMHEGDTISAPLKSQRMGVCLSLGTPGKEKFGPAKDLLPLSDMDGSVDLFAYDTDGSCFRVLISSKPCRYQAVPIKVLSIRPYMTFTNRVGQDIFIRFNAEDEEKVLSASDTRVSFIYREIQGTEQLQVRMEDTEWSFPVEILKEDTITLMLRNLDGGRKFLRLEVRGHEEGSQFLIVFRPGSSRCPIRIENRLTDMKINIRQSTLGDDAWVTVHPHSCISFALETPYGPSLVDFYIQNGNVITGQTISLETTPGCYTNLHKEGFDLYFLECGDTRIIRILSIKKGLTEKLERHHSDASTSNGENQSCIERKSTALPVNLVIELGVVGISLVDHRPRELLYLSLEKVFLSYSSCYDGGNSNRFKLIIGQLQMDNQLPFTVMPVLFMPERTADACHPVFKATISMSNDNIDGTEVYPYVYIRVTENYWRVNIHEPIIWALVDFYNNIQIDRASNAPNITVIDPEIRIKKIDVSEMRFKVSLETSPTERPHGVLGIWSPLLSAVGNAFKVQIRLRKVVHDNRFMRKSAIAPAIINRVKRDLVHNPLHLILSVDVLGMTKSTLASLSKGFAELSTDVEFLQLRSKQVWSRKITSVSDGILQGTEAFAQGLAFGVSGVVTKPVESAREYGILGVPQGFLRAILGVVVQPVSGVLDFVSLTVDGIGASFARCLDLLSNKSIPQRIRNPRAFHANGLISEYSEREATGQMILYLAETSRHFGCTDIFKEPSKFAWSDLYEDHFLLPHQRILLITNKRALLLLCLDPEKIDKRPCKIVWDVPWEELLALELAKAGYPEPSHLIIHLKNFRKSESFVRLVKCNVDFEESQSPQAVRICSAIQKMWKARLLDMKTLTLRVPSSQRYVQFSWDELASDGSERRMKSMINTRRFISSSSFINERRFVKHVVNFQKIWSSERDLHSRCILYPKQVADDAMLCSLWRPVCPDGYVSIGDIARLGIHPPTVAAVYRDSPGSFAEPVGFDLVWRNCTEDYTTPLSIWSPRPPEGFASVGCVAVAGFEEPTPDSLYCVNTRLSREANFEDQIVWTSPDSYPWSCYIYAVQSEDLHLLALRQPREVSSLRPLRVYVPSEEN